jgi:multisubunit Na+/H+ antiporter MnhB subunit
MTKNTLRSIGAIVAGFLSVLVLSIVTDVVLQRTGVFPPQTDQAAYHWWMLLIALVYRTGYGTLGGYLAARLAPNRPMRHAIILGSIGAVFALLGSIANWDKTTPSTTWYPILLIVLTLPSVWLGGKLRTGQVVSPNE